MSIFLILGRGQTGVLFEKPAEVGYAFKTQNIRNFRNGEAAVP